MIYMVEMDFPHPERLQEWHDWYLAHIRVLLTVPGFSASEVLPGITGHGSRGSTNCDRARQFQWRDPEHAREAEPSNP